MHELSIVKSVFSTAENACRQNNVKNVSKITVQAGAFSGIEERFMQNCWQAVRQSTAFENTELIIETVPGRVKCTGCGREFSVNSPVFACGECSGVLKIVSGTDIVVSQLEAEI